MRDWLSLLSVDNGQQDSRATAVRAGGDWGGKDMPEERNKILSVPGKCVGGPSWPKTDEEKLLSNEPYMNQPPFLNEGGRGSLEFYLYGGICLSAQKGFKSILVFLVQKGDPLNAM